MFFQIVKAHLLKIELIEVDLSSSYLGIHKAKSLPPQEMLHTVLPLPGHPICAAVSFFVIQISAQ